MKKLSDKMSPLALTDDVAKQDILDNSIATEPGKNEGCTSDIEHSGNIKHMDAELSSGSNIIIDSKKNENETQALSNKEAS